MTKSNRKTIFISNVWLLLCFLVELNYISLTNAKNSTIQVASPPVNFGDSPHWCQATGSIYFVDRNGSTIHRTEVVSKNFYSAKLSDAEEVSFIVPIDGAPNKYAIGIGKKVGIYYWDGVVDGPLTATLTIPVGDGSDTIFTGKADPTGRLYVSMKNGFLYSIDPDQKVTEQLSMSGQFTGMAWNPSTSDFYRLNVDLMKALRYTYSAETGAITPGCIEAFDFIGPEYPVTPNGLDVDVDGNLWVGALGIVNILHIDPNTEVCIHTLNLPNIVGTCSTFGEPGLDVVYLTSMKNTEAGSGSLYRTPGTGIKGNPDVAAKINV